MPLPGGGAVAGGRRKPALGRRIHRRPGGAAPRPRQHHSGEPGAIGGVGPERAVALHQPDQCLRGERGGEGGGGTRRRSRRAPRGGSASSPQPHPLSAAAPTITGSATVRESMFDCCRVKPRQRAARQGGAVSRDAGSQGGGLGEAEREPVGGCRSASLADLRPAVGERPSPRRRRAGRRQSPAGPPRRRSIGRSRTTPRIAGGRKERATTAALRASKVAQLLRDHPSLADQAERQPPPRGARPRSCCRARDPGRSGSQPASQGIRVRCAELETGRSSVGPWTAPRTIALDRSIMKRVAPRLQWRASRHSGGPAAPAPDQRPDDQGHDGASTA